MFARCRGGCCKKHPGLEPLGGMRGSLVLASGNGRSAGEEGEGRGEREREARSSPKHCENRLASPQHLAIYGLAACFQGDGCEGMMRGGRGLQECCSGAAPGCWSPAGPAPCPHCRAALGQRGWAPGGESPEQCCCRPHKRPHSASGVRGVPTWPGGDAGSPQGCFKAQHRRQAPSCQCVQEGMLSA